MPKTLFRVLLVDESTFFLTMENQFLRKLPVTVQEVYRGAQALAICREEPPDLVYMAFNLPDGSGAECCRQMKTDAALRNIPVVIVCNGGSDSQLEMAKNACCDAVVTRPLNRRRFLELAHHFLAGVGEMRRLCRLRVLVQTRNHTFSASGLDISSGGMFIAATQPMAPGVPVRMELQLPPPAAENTWIPCRGDVSWINADSDGPKPYYPLGFGVKFTEMADTDRDLLNQYLLAKEK